MLENKKVERIENESKAFAPYSYHHLVNSTKIGAVCLQTLGESVSSYNIQLLPIKEFVKSPVYSRFTFKGDNVRIAFNKIAKLYKASKTAEGAQLFREIAAAIQNYNRELISRLTIQLKLKEAAFYDELRLRSYMNDMRARWEQLTDKDYSFFDTLSEEDRVMLLDRAADLGVTPNPITVDTKDVYTFRPAALAEEADDIRPYNIYHEIGKGGYEGEGIVTVVGKYSRTVVTRAAENEAMAIALELSKYGDEFLMKTTTPDGVVTRRDIRLGLVEDEPIEFRDFQYEPEYDAD